MNYPKRLIEVDLPIRRISAHARADKRVRNGHIQRLHMWWARRPLAACRSVICAALWPDSADPLCPASFRKAAEREMRAFAQAAITEKEVAVICDAEAWSRYSLIARNDKPITNLSLRGLLLDFVADAAAWEASTHPLFFQTARNLTSEAHKALGDATSERPLIVDPFAGGGAIPLEALREGADSFALDLNPVAVLLNSIILEYIPQYGLRLGKEVAKYGEYLKQQTTKSLLGFYPSGRENENVMAYLWARTVTCHGPSCGIDVPMVNQCWIQKKGKPTWALNITAQGGKTIKISLLQNPSPRDVGSGTTSGGNVTCPRCGFTTKANDVRKFGCEHGFGMRMMAVICIGSDGSRSIREPQPLDSRAITAANSELSSSFHGWPLLEALKTPIPHTELRRISVPLYGINDFESLFTNRQKLALCVYNKTLLEIRKLAAKDTGDEKLANAIVDILSVAVSNMLHYNTSLSTYLSNGMVSAFIQGTSLAMRSDFAEANPCMPRLVGGFDFSLGLVLSVIKNLSATFLYSGCAQQGDARSIPLPDESAHLVVTDPPYYDSIPYAHLSDVFYLWLCSNKSILPLKSNYSSLTNKDDEIVEDRRHSRSPRTKDADYFENGISAAMRECRRIIRLDSPMVVVFAHKSTYGWEAMVKGLLEAGWMITGSWPLDTERPDRMNAYQNASLLSSVHVVCRPRVGEVIGDWREVLAELPRRIHKWMPRLSKEGIVGADAIFACLGPALEIFSRYARVEKASGEAVSLRDYLEKVWGAVSQEALRMLFEGTDASGFEEDARLTAMWLWTLSTGNGKAKANGVADEDEEADTDDADSKKRAGGGYALEFDTARKIAQGLGAHLENLHGIVTVEGDEARLLSVAERTKALFGKDQADAPTGKRKKKRDVQGSLFAEFVEEAESDGGWGEKGAPKVGETTLDRIHQSMILFAAGRSEAMRRFLVEEGVGRDGRFWTLAQALSALYPAGTDEKRWVDGVLARKKGLGF